MIQRHILQFYISRTGTSYAYEFIEINARALSRRPSSSPSPSMEDGAWRAQGRQKSKSFNYSVDFKINRWHRAMNVDVVTIARRVQIKYLLDELWSISDEKTKKNRTFFCYPFVHRSNFNARRRKSEAPDYGNMSGTACLAELSRSIEKHFISSWSLSLTPPLSLPFSHFIFVRLLLFQLKSI